MTGRTHKKIAVAFAASSIAIGTVACKGLYADVGGITLVPVLWGALAVAGGYASDIDKRGTTARSFFNKIFSAYTVLAAILVVAALVLKIHMYAVFAILFSEGIFVGLYFLMSVSKHRRESHSILFITSILLIAWGTYIGLYEINKYTAIILFNLLIGFAIGVVSHIHIDRYNPRHVHAFFPLEILLMKIFKRKKPVWLARRLGTVVTGSAEEPFCAKKFVGKTIIFTIVVCTLIILRTEVWVWLKDIKLS